MGIDIHAANLIAIEAARAPLGDVLTIGRQSMAVSAAIACARAGTEVAQSDYCEPFLFALGATSIESIDYSGYEGATHVADMGAPVSLPRQYETVLDSGSLEHIFDVGCAFRNIIRACRVGGRIIHLLPVNNLSGHGFWQFSSDLMYSIYSDENGFSDTEVFYASSLDADHWYKVPQAKPGVRVEMISIEPIILLCVATKLIEKEAISVTQPFYLRHWSESEAVPSTGQSLRKKWRGRFESLFGARARRALRNAVRIFDLLVGRSRYSLEGSQYEKVKVARLLAGMPS